MVLKKPFVIIGELWFRLREDFAAEAGRCCRKRFFWRVTKVFGAAGASQAHECEGPHRITRDRPRSFVHVLLRLAAAEAAKNRLSRDFGSCSIFDFSTASVMMGRQTVDQSQLFYLFNLERRIPERHLLRRINPIVTRILVEFREKLEPFYSEIGRPLIDPELMIRMLIVGYCYGTRFERRLCGGGVAPRLSLVRPPGSQWQAFQPLQLLASPGHRPTRCVRCRSSPASSGEAR